MNGKGSHIQLIKRVYKYNRFERLSGICGSSNSQNVLLPRCLYSSWRPGSQLHLKEKLVSQWTDFYSRYEEFVGLTDVQDAQLEVKNAEKKFLQARGEERAIMRNVGDIRDQLRHVRERLSHVNYSSPLYPQLANEQHELVTEEEKMKSKVEAAAENERDSFLELSAAMRDSYEKERARVERTKNWSLIGSVVGTLIGMLGSFYINRIRTEGLKQAIEDKSQFEEVKENIAVVLPSMQEQYDDIKEEIKQLQVCLINKLLDPPSNAASSTRPNEDPASSLKAVNKVLQSFQSQLLNLLQNSSDSKEMLSAQANNLLGFSQSLKRSESTSEEIQCEIAKIKNGLQQIQVILSTGSVPAVEQNTTFSDQELLFGREKLNQGHVYPWLIWGGAMTALYFILNFG